MKSWEVDHSGVWESTTSFTESINPAESANPGILIFRVARKCQWTRGSHLQIDKPVGDISSQDWAESSINMF